MLKIAHPVVGVLEFSRRDSKLVKCCKTCKTYIADSKLIKKRKAKRFKSDAKELQPQ